MKEFYVQFSIHSNLGSSESTSTTSMSISPLSWLSRRDSLSADWRVFKFPFSFLSITAAPAGATVLATRLTNSIPSVTCTYNSIEVNNTMLKIHQLKKNMVKIRCLKGALYLVTCWDKIPELQQRGKKNERTRRNLEKNMGENNSPLGDFHFKSQEFRHQFAHSENFFLG